MTDSEREVPTPRRELPSGVMERFRADIAGRPELVAADMSNEFRSGRDIDVYEEHDRLRWLLGIDYPGTLLTDDADPSPDA